MSNCKLKNQILNMVSELSKKRELKNNSQWQLKNNKQNNKIKKKFLSRFQLKMDNNNKDKK